MKILLIQPPIRDFYQTSIRTQPLGLAYLAASLQRCGQEVGNQGADLKIEFLLERIKKLLC